MVNFPTKVGFFTIVFFLDPCTGIVFSENIWVIWLLRISLFPYCFDFLYSKVSSFCCQIFAKYWIYKSFHYYRDCRLMFLFDRNSRLVPSISVFGSSNRSCIPHSRHFGRIICPFSMTEAQFPCEARFHVHVFVSGELIFSGRIITVSAWLWEQHILHLHVCMHHPRQSEPTKMMAPSHHSSGQSCPGVF